MKTLILSIVIAISAVLAPVFVQQAPLVSAASSQQEVLGGVNDAGDCNNKACADKRVNSIFTTAIIILTYIIGVVSVIMIMVGGFKYITSNGDSNSVSNAKSTIIYAMVGLVVVALTQFLIRVVLNITG